jgi:hypothetical protein
MLKYGINALKAMPRLFSYRNDIDIFTEDKVADKEFYKTLFQNLLGEHIKINDVTPLGCKANVLNAYDTQNLKDKRKKFFIIDGDLDLIIGTNRKEENNLIILDSYCIENYLIDEKGIIDFLYFSNGTEAKDQIKLKLNFDKWLNYNSKCLIDLFLNFAILKKYGGGPILKNANEFLKQENKQTILDQSKIEKYSEKIKIEIINHLESSGFSDAEKIYKTNYKDLSKVWKTDNQTLLKIVSAKNYLLPLLQFRINHCINKGKALFPRETIKLFLASNSKLERLEFLKNKIK